MRSVNILRKTFSLLHIYIAIFMCRRVSSITLFDKSKSYAIFDIWNITNVGKLELRFKTQTQYCLLLYVDDNCIDEDNNINYGNYIDLSLVSGKIEITQQISEVKYKKTIKVGNNLNDLRWHYLTLTKFVDTLQIQVDDVSDVITFTDPKDISSKFKINSKLYIGGLSESKIRKSYGSAKMKTRFVGCIEGLRYSSGSYSTSPVDRFLKGESLASSCHNACKPTSIYPIKPCNNSGKCINLFDKTSCDCFGTGYDGERCTAKTETIHLGDKDYIKWNIRDRSPPITSLRFRFKTLKGDGLIYYTKRKDNILAVELVKGKLRVALPNPPNSGNPEDKVSSKNLFDAKWHTVVIYKKNNVVMTTIDGRLSMNLTGTITSGQGESNTPPVFFGGVNQPEFTFGVKSKNNFIGCLQQIQYNTADVIYKAQKTINSRITKFGNIKIDCPFNKSNIVIPTTKPAPTKRVVTVFQPTPKAERIETKVIKEIHTNNSGLGQTVIVWITAAIVVGTILIMISAACVVHHLRNHQVNKPKSKTSLVDEDEEVENNSHKGSNKSILEATVLNALTKGEKEEKEEKEAKCPDNEPFVDNDCGI